MEFMGYDSKIFPSFRWIIWKYFTASKALKGFYLKLLFHKSQQAMDLLKSFLYQLLSSE